MPQLDLHEDITGPRGERVLVRRSARRRRSVSITRREGDLVIAIPASFSRRQEREWVRKMVEQLARKEERSAPARRSDASLAAIARELSERYLGGRAHPTSVTWSARQQRRWGSCTPSEGTIRLSTRLQGMPDWVLRSVVMHELVHLLVPDHGPDFYALMNRYPRAERARGFLDGVSWAGDLPQGIDDPDATDPDASDPDGIDPGAADPGTTDPDGTEPRPSNGDHSVSPGSHPQLAEEFDAPQIPVR